jgi:hypothetical protein
MVVPLWEKNGGSRLPGHRSDAPAVERSGIIPPVWRITVRDGPRVEKHKAQDRDEALDLVEREARVLAAGPGRQSVALRTRTFTPQRQVAGRVELAGRGVRAGIDVRGDGAAEAWTGRVRRQVIEQRERETPYDALRRFVAQSTSVEP